MSLLFKRSAFVLHVVLLIGLSLAVGSRARAAGIGSAIPSKSYGAVVVNDPAKLNGKTVIQNAQLPGVPEKGPLALQHHGGFKDGKYSPASSLVQFRHISIREL